MVNDDDASDCVCVSQVVLLLSALVGTVVCCLGCALLAFVTDIAVCCPVS